MLYYNKFNAYYISFKKSFLLLNYLILFVFIINLYIVDFLKFYFR